MRQLFPAAVDPVDPRDVYRDAVEMADRPSVRLNMVASVDGATTLAGRSGGLAAAADRSLFHLLRALSDVVLVGASTARVEGYGPARLTPALQDERRSRGLPATPPIAVVTRTCAFDWESPFFTAAARPVLVTVDDAPSEQLARAAEVADVVRAGKSSVDPALALAALAERGARRVVCEGGPVLNSELAAAGVIDELALTVSPLLAGGEAKRVLHAGLLTHPSALALSSVCEEDGFLFLLYRRA